MATKGRPQEAAILVRHLSRQSVKPKNIVVVGSSPEDVAAVSADILGDMEVSVLVSESAGITIQRNVGLKWLISKSMIQDRSIVIFFDDDFRPADDWIEQCLTVFCEHRDVVGMTGLILADGAQSGAMDEDRADSFLDNTTPPLPHWASGSLREIASVYGCNMAFTGSVMTKCEFDENLPLYSWQEDRDMTGQAAALGRVLFTPTCRGVHLGSKGGRTSGLRFGYSQIANMFYLYNKGTIDLYQLFRFVSRSLVSNSLRSIHTRRNVDYRGRLKGNLKAALDVIRGCADPRRILDM